MKRYRLAIAFVCAVVLSRASMEKNDGMSVSYKIRDGFEEPQASGGV